MTDLRIRRFLNRRAAIAAVIGAVFAFEAIRIGLFVHRYAVNLLFCDEWDFLTPEFDGLPLWKRFVWQHGPHRQGIGALVSSALHPLTAWDGRAEAWAAFACTLLASGLALLLVRRMTGRLTVFDAAIPALFLTIHGFEIYVGTTNLAHGPVPMVLLVGFALALQVRRDALRVPLMLLLNFCAIYTGFAVFLGVVTPVVTLILTALLWKEPKRRWTYFAGLVVSLVSMASFRIDYQWSPAVTCFKFPDDHPANYLKFTAMVLARPLGAVGTRGLRLPVALAISLVIAGAGIWALLRLIRSHGSDSGAAAIFSFAAFAFLFAANSAMGRVCLGVEAAEAPRYVPYAIFGSLAVYLCLRIARVDDRLKTTLLLAVAIVFLARDGLAHAQNMEQVHAYADGKAKWKACYLEYEDAERCDSESGLTNYPNPETTHLSDKLNYLKERKLNLFDGD